MTEREALLLPAASSAKTPPGTPTKSESEKKTEARKAAEQKGKQPTTPKKKENFVSIFDIVGK